MLLHQRSEQGTRKNQIGIADRSAGLRQLADSAPRDRALQSNLLAIG